MGRPKAWLPFGRERMLQRVVRLVSTAAQPVVVVAAKNQALPELAPAVVIARDRVAGRGPLEGLAAGLAALPGTTELVYATATDVPFLDPRLITILAGFVEGYDLAMPFVGGFHHPLAAVYRRKAVLPAIDALLRAGRLRTASLVEAVRSRVVHEDELKAVDPLLQSLRNLNSPEEYERALRDAACQGGGSSDSLLE
jgi:molybdopterin-guanine dinucleotide biosynthesis protein A